MNLLVRRLWPGPKATEGVLYTDGAAECFTLEDPVREVPGQPVEQWKIDGDTAIPVGLYKVVIDFSDRFKRKMPHILDVPGFTSIRIHPGNTEADTHGCILVGEHRIDGNHLGHSLVAFDLFFTELDAAIARGEEVSITVENSSNEPDDAWPGGN